MALAKSTEQGMVACMLRSRHATVGIAAVMDRTDAWSAFTADDYCYGDCGGGDDERSLIVPCRKRCEAKRSDAKRSEAKRSVEERIEAKNEATKTNCAASS